MRGIVTGLAVCLCLWAASPTDTLARADTIRLLWKDPGPVAGRDLHWGIGSPERAPKPPFTFVAENLSGTKPKVDVTDAAGVAWSVKLAAIRPEQNEVHAEIAATRIVGALGYFVDENYFVPDGRIDGVKDLRRAAEVIGPDGAFRTARFERRPDGAERRGEWDIEDNPFRGTRELAGLQTLMMLLGNWDWTPGNAVILRVPLANGDVEERFLVSDLGSTFGRMKGGLNKSPSRWNIRDYTEAGFINRVVQARLEFRGPLTGAAPFAIPFAHARWLASLASELDERQIRQAFEASGAPARDVEAFTAQVVKRFAELQAAVTKGR